MSPTRYSLPNPRPTFHPPVIVYLIQGPPCHLPVTLYLTQGPPCHLPVTVYLTQGPPCHLPVTVYLTQGPLCHPPFTEKGNVSSSTASRLQWRAPTPEPVSVCLSLTSTCSGSPHCLWPTRDSTHSHSLLNECAHPLKKELLVSAQSHRDTHI